MTAAVAATDLGRAHIFLTGGTGFVGQAILERLLSTHPETTISLLVRVKGSATGEDRLRTLAAQAGVPRVARARRRRRRRGGGARPDPARRGRPRRASPAARRPRPRHPQRLHRVVRSADRSGVRHQRRRRHQPVRDAAGQRRRSARRACLHLLRRRHPQGRRARGAAHARGRLACRVSGRPERTGPGRAAVAASGSAPRIHGCRPDRARQGGPAGGRAGRRGGAHRVGHPPPGRRRPHARREPGLDRRLHADQGIRRTRRRGAVGRGGPPAVRRAPGHHRERAEASRSPAGSTASRSPTR